MAICLCLVQSACVDNPSAWQDRGCDLGSLDGAILEDLGVSGSDAILEAPRLVVVCGESAACELDQASEEMKTNDTIPLRVSVESRQDNDWYTRQLLLPRPHLQRT